MPHIDYVSVVWDGSSGNNLKHLCSLYKRSINLLSLDPSKKLEENLISMNLLPLKSRFIFNKCVLMHKSLHYKAPIYLQLSFCNSRSSRFNQSRNNVILLPKPRIDLFKTSFVYSGIQHWNQLPNPLKQPMSTTLFKKRLHAHLRDMCTGSIV